MQHEDSLAEDETCGPNPHPIFGSSFSPSLKRRVLGLQGSPDVHIVHRVRSIRNQVPLRVADDMRSSHA